MLEIRQIPNYERYFIDTDGNVYNRSGKLLKPFRTAKGFLCIRLSNENGRRTFRVSRLVMLTFNPHPNQDRLVVLLKDGNKDNVSLDNLKWESKSENIRINIRSGLQINMGNKGGVFRILTKGEIETIKHLGRLGYTRGEIATIVKCSPRTVSRYINNTYTRKAFLEV